MANGQQGFQSFDDFDKFLKQPPKPPSTQGASGPFKDFSAFDSFISNGPAKQQPPEKPPAPMSWGEVSPATRPAKKLGSSEEIGSDEASKVLKDRFGIQVDPKNPKIHDIWKDAWGNIDPMHHPLNFLSDMVNIPLQQIHEKAFDFFGDVFVSRRQGIDLAVKDIHAALNEESVKKDPQKKKQYEDLLKMYTQRAADLDRDEKTEGVKWNDPGVLARAASTTYVDWESMGALFRPMELAAASKLVKNSKVARTGLYLINQALGADFAWPSWDAGEKKWQEGDRLEAIREWGTGAAMLFMPLMHHVMTESGITQEQIRQKASEVLEEKKREVEQRQRENPDAVQPVTPQAIQEMQTRVAGGYPLLKVRGSQPAEELITKAQVRNRVEQLEKQKRDLGSEGQKIVADRSVSAVDRQRHLTELDAKTQDLDRQIERERGRLAGAEPQVAPMTEPPTPEKRPFQEEPSILEGRPQTREEREDQWLEERRKRYTDELAFEREQERDRRLREGEEFKVEDKRRVQPDDVDREVARLSDLANEAKRRGDHETAMRLNDQANTMLSKRLGNVEIAIVDSKAQPFTKTPSDVASLSLTPTPRDPGTVVAAAALENMDLEAQKAKASPEEAVAIDRRQEENRKIASDIAASMEARKKPKGFKAGDRLTGPVGKLTELKTVTQNYPVRYRVVEGSQLRTSHDPVNFEPVKGYPADVQERDYLNDKDAQLAVIQHTQGYDPNFTLSDAPGPEHGPPMVTPDGVVLGGNSRAMSTLRLYREGGGSSYRNALLERAAQLGLDGPEVAAMKEPILIREIITPPQDIQGMRALGSDLNRVFTRKLSEFEQAVSAGKRLSPETLEFVLQQLTYMGDGASLRDVLRDPKKARDLLAKLEADGVVAPTERRQFIDEKTDTLNDTGKDFVENAILGSVIDDPQVLANAPKSVLRKIERSLSSIAKIKARGGVWDITDYIKEALREHIAATSKGVSIEEHIKPSTGSLFAREKMHSIVEGIARKLGEGGAEVKKAFDEFAADAERDVKDQGTMAFVQPPVPWESFKSLFGVDVRPEEWGTVRSTPEPTPAGVEARTVTSTPAPLTSAPEEPSEPVPELLEPVVKKKSEFTEEPTRSLEESIKAMSDDDLRTAAKSIESQTSRGEITVRAKQELQKQLKPFREEMEKRNIPHERGFGEKNTIFTKDRAQAARDRLRDKIRRQLSAGIDPEAVRDVAEIMGYYFEGGIRDLASISKKVLAEFGDAIRPVLHDAYDLMINNGRQESKTAEQIDLFKPIRDIVLPTGVEEVRREPETSPREARPPNVPLGTTPDEGVRPERRPTVRQNVGETARPEAGVREPAPGRTARAPGKGVGGSGVVERFEQPLRNVRAPRIDAPHITDIPTTVEPAEWRRSLKDANLPETLPPPTETISPATDQKLAFKGQPEIVRTILTSLRKYHGAILASSTGSGKTWMGSAIIAEKKPRFSLVVTPSQNIAQQWIDVAKNFGVEMKMLEKNIPTEPGHYVTTYSTATNRKGLDKMNFNLVIADESHYARRWHDEGNKRGKFLIELGKNADDVLYTSATPFHTPLELGYFEKLGLWSKTGLDNWLRDEFGVRQDAAGKYIVPMNFRKLAALREELISRGMFVNLDRNMDGYSANFSVVPMSPETADGIRSATKAFRMAEEYFKSKNQKKMIMAVRGNATTFMKSFLERQRLPEAIELGKKLESEGWKVIYFTESKKEVDDIYDFLRPADDAYGGEISRNLPRLPNVVETLQNAFGDDLANFTGAHSGKRQADMEAFNQGRKKHLVATYGAGGVGVSLHDTSEGGKSPRAVIYLGPPWSGVMFDQAIGRPWRFGTNSNVSAYFLTSNAQPEMKLIFQKVLPRFESLKASVSGIKKTDPIVSAMKDLDSYLAYEFGNDSKVGFDSFMNTVPTSAVSSYKEATITSAESAMGKGMKVARRLLTEELGELDLSKILKLGKTPDREVPEDLRSVEGIHTEKYEKSIDALRRMFVPEGTEKKINDPRLLDQINDENRATLGLEGGEKPPRPPREVVGTQQIPRPGEAKVSRQDLAYPKAMKWVRDWAEQHFSEYGMPIRAIDSLAQVESSWRLGHAEKRDASNVLRQFPETAKIADTATKAERQWARDTANTQYEYTNILKNLGILGNEIAERKVDQALRLTDQGFSTMSLLGQPSKYLDGSVFNERELRAAQLIRERVYEPVWNKVKEVRPEMGYRRKYSAVIPTTEALAGAIYPELNGEIPADLRQFFSLEIRRGMTKDPFSPHVLKRRGEPPKTWRITDVLDAYVPSMLKVAHYTDASHFITKELASLPPKSVLREYATKYSRIFFGVPSEYAHMDQIKYRASRMITNAIYSGALEANPGWFTMHLTKVPINCVDTETEALTKDGWRKYDQLKIGQEILCYDIKTDQSYWMPICNLFVGWHYGELFSLESENISARTTEGHRWAVEHRLTKERFTVQNELEITTGQGKGVRSKKVLNNSHCIPLARPIGIITDVSSFTDDFVSLCGWISTEGHYLCDGRKGRKTYGKFQSVELSQSSKANPEKVKEILELFSRLKIKVGERRDRRSGVLIWRLPAKWGRKFKQVMPHKAPAMWFINLLTRKQLQLLLDAMLRGDGSKRKRVHWEFANTNKEILDAVQMIATLLGVTTTQFPMKPNRLSDTPIAYVSLKYGFRSRVAYVKSARQKPVPYEGIVWCPSVLTGFWVARRNGKVFCTGNTWPELGKGGMKYITKGYSRMMTEEGRELVARSGVLMDKMWVFPDKFYEFKKKPSNWLRITTSLSDTVDRVASYLAAFEKAKDMGFLGNPERVGEITWQRLNELAAEGVDVEKAFAYADSVMARSEFFYTPAHVQMWQREHPFMGMFKNYIFREADFISSLRSISKEVKAQPDPDAYVDQKVSEGHYEYIDAIAKYRRFLLSLTGAAITAAGIGGPIFGRFWPLHLGRLLAPPVAFAADTMDLVVKTLEGKATELEWENFAHSLLRMMPYVGGVVGTVDAFSGGPEIKRYTVTRRKKHQNSDFGGMEKFKFSEMPK